MSDFHKDLDQKRWRVVRRRVLDRDGWRCKKCGRPGRLECHHIVRLADGGARYDPDNLEIRCYDCHNSEHRHDRRADRENRASLLAWADYLRGLTGVTRDRAFKPTWGVFLY